MAYNAVLDSNFIQYASRTYYVMAQLNYEDKDESKSFSLPLDMQQTAKIEIENSLNDFLMRGNIIYADQMGEVDKFLQCQNVKCMITIALMSKKFDSNVDNINLSTVKNKSDACIQHQFIVDRIRPVRRDDSTIVYEIDLVSSLWFNCTANLDPTLTTYKDQPQKTTQLLKKAMTQAGLEVDAQTFDNVLTDVSIEFMSRDTDNVLTVYKHLMNKLFFYSTMDQSLKMIAYDAIERKYKIIDLAKVDTSSSVTPVVMSFFKTTSEGLVHQKKTDIGSYINAINHTQTMNTMSDYRVISYSLADNKIVTDVMSSKSIQGVMNNTQMTDRDSLKRKYESMDEVISQRSLNSSDRSSSSLSRHNSSMIWNSSSSLYQEMADSVMYDNAIVLDIDVDIKCQPGTYVSVSIDRSLKMLDSDYQTALKRLVDKYKVFEDIWIVSKVITTIVPNQRSITQKTALFRNFAVKLNPSK